jgi:hypothetical protein
VRNPATSAEAIFLPVDRHPLVLDGIMGRDALYRAARENRVRRIWVSSKRLLIHRDAIEDLMRAEKPG